ncbi:DEAH (Asp-Glu-Ala-His) box polypeptide 34, partial [Nowakowskiella sp. JEL0078]
MNRDKTLSAYNVIIVDEVHERNMTGDFLLGVLKQVLRRRKDLRVVLMSATINANLFAKFFNAPIVEIPGRMFPVSIEYHPVTSEEDKNLVQRKPHDSAIPARPDSAGSAPYLRLLERIDSTIPINERGDVLIFLPGMKEIISVADSLREYAAFTKKWIVLPLHSTLSISDQEKVFHVAPSGIRKVILSTNIAETSVTIDGIRFIIDSGKVKQIAYDPKKRMTKLSEFWIADSSAKQRTGRAGRTGPGVVRQSECFRLYTENEYASLPSFPVPEIRRVQVHPLALQIVALGLGDPLNFDFVEKPEEESLKEAMIALRDLGAIVGEAEVSENQITESEIRVTRLGGMLALLPVDVVMGKMLVLGSISDLIYPTIVIAAALSVQSPFIRISDSNVGVSEMRRELMSDEGDPFTLLNIFSEWLHVKAEGKTNSSNWCRRRGIEEQRLYEMVKLKTQFEQVLGKYLLNSGENDSDDENDNDNESKNRKRKKIPGEENEDSWWNDPEYHQKRQQRQLLDREKRSQKQSKRKFLKLEDGEDDPGDEMEIK